MAQQETGLTQLTGGLTHIEEMTFALFQSLEEEDEYQECLKQLSSKPDHARKSEIMQKLLSNDDVQFYWCIISADFETDDIETRELLKMIAELSNYKRLCFCKHMD